MLQLPISIKKEEQVMQLYAGGSPYREITQTMGWKNDRTSERIVAKARREGDPRAKHRYRINCRTLVDIQLLGREISTKEKLLKEIEKLSLHWSATEIAAWTGLRLHTILEWRKTYNIPHMSHVEAHNRSKKLWHRMWPRYHQYQTPEAVERWQRRKNARSSQIKSMARD